MNWNTLKKLIIPIIVVIGLGVACIVLNNQRLSKNKEIELIEQNYKAAQQELNILQLKTGELIAYQEGYILEKKKMAAELEMSTKQIDELQKKLGKIESVTKIETRVKFDTIYIESEPLVVNDTIQVPIKYSDDWLRLTGFTHIADNKASTTLSEVSVDVPLMVGKTDENKFFATSTNPYVKITNVTGVSNVKSIKDKSHWGLGLNLGPGIYYSPVDKKLDWGVGLQVGISYNF